MADPLLPPIPDRQNPPYAPQNPHEIRQLLQSLQSHKAAGKGKSSFRCKETSFSIPQLGGRSLSSWKMNEWDYKRDDLPTYARGLFTYRRTDGTSEIAVRGYDKFFNIDEVNETQWRNIENRTRGPYELSNKENGCIIFIAGLEGDEIVVCSKHSTGNRVDGSANHSLQGTRWLEKHLAAAGRTTRDLARDLRNRNVTLVAELCDDSFEEHVLEYRPEDSGLYVHGMNLNLPEFATYPFHLVQQFADEWGFRKAKYIVKDNLNDAKAFLEQCGETGSWNGRDTEGFVIRCQKKLAGGWVDWFFKYKYDEPYLMYRQWREATKAVIAGKKPKYRKHRKVTEAYLIYARQQLARDPKLAGDYQRNHGIIAMREGFLKQQGVKGSEIIRAEEYDEEEAGSTHNVSDNVILVPISTIGCGKTTIANALVSLFGWGHIQNDNITGQKGRPQKFANQLTNAMALHPAVIADRNNHQKRERKQIFEDILKIVPSARFVALHYVHHPKDQMVPLIREVTLTRVLGRGDNHQTIRASSKGSSEIEGIMDGFLTRFERPLADSEPDNTFDEIIDMDPREDSRQNLETVVNALHKSFPKLVPTLPTSEEMDNAINASLNDYSPQLKHDLSFGGNKKDKNNNNNKQKQGGAADKLRTKDRKVEYFAIKLPRQPVLDCLEQIFRQAGPPVFWNTLKVTNRVQTSFHVTLIHSSASKSQSEIWKNYEERQFAAVAGGSKEADPYLGPASIRLKHIVWDNQVMAVAVEILDDAWLCNNAFPHITIGTANQDIKPKQSNDLLASWHERGSGGASGINALPIIDYDNVVHGEVRAVTPVTR